MLYFLGPERYFDARHAGDLGNVYTTLAGETNVNNNTSDTHLVTTARREVLDKLWAGHGMHTFDTGR